MPKEDKRDRGTWKAQYFVKLIELFDEYPRCFVVGIDNVGSRQMQEIRAALRGHAECLMGKNTMIRKAIRGHLNKNPALEKLLPYIVENVGFVFTKEDLGVIRDKLTENRKPAPAKTGAIAPIDVSIPAQNTGMGPEKTSFFQALGIPTKISKGTIEIMNDVHIIKKGEKVGASESTLLGMLNVHPFDYGLQVRMVYDSGTCFEPHVLDITTADLRAKLLAGVTRVASISLAIKYPTVASAPHLLANGFKNLMAVAAVSDVEFEQAKKMKEYLKDPSKFAVAAAPAAAPAAAAKAAAPAKKEEKKEESEEEEGDMGFGLFD